MSQTFTCGDHEALVSYLYDECERSERRMISAHLALCSACAAELSSLGVAREALGSWSPPEALLGFRIVSDPPRSNVLRPARWWRQPLPAWAQAAAAVVIFATGATLGVLKGATVQRPSGSQPVNVAARTATATPVTHSDLAALEQRLRAELSQVRPAAVARSTNVNEAEILQRVQAMIQDSEQRQERELGLRTAEVVRDFDAQRRVDLTRIEHTLGQMDGTNAEVEQQRQVLNYLMRVSQRGQ